VISLFCLHILVLHYIKTKYFCGREYQAAADELQSARDAFRRDAASRELSRREQHLYPPHLLHDIPDFVEWLAQYTTQLVHAQGSCNVDIELQRLAVLPSRHAETYQQMWAYGNHYRVLNDGDSHGFVTQDYGIASIFGAEDGQSAGVNLVGVLKEIIVVRYSAQRRVVFRGSWIRNDCGPRSSTKIDQYGFTLVRFHDRIARDREPYVLPATVRQVLQFLYLIDSVSQCACLCWD
jgi:hypothetical protein